MIARAQRLEKLPPYLFAEIATLKRKAIAEGRDLIDLGIGDPDQPTPNSIIDALKEAAQDPETHRYDETPAGWIPFLEAVATWAGRRFDVSIDPAKEAMLLIGSKEGLAHLAWAYIDPGDLALVPDPAYTVYRINTQMAGGDVYVMPLREQNGFLPDLTAIPSDVARKAKMLWLNYPNNPTGAVAPLSFYADAVAFARDYDLLLVNDAAYVECYYDPANRPPSVLQVPGSKDVAIELHSLSKMFNMTGWRLGFAIGNPDAIAALNKLKSNLDSKQFPAISMAGAHALLHGDNRPTLELYRRRRDILCDGLNALGWNVRKPDATFYVWARVPGGYTSIEFAKVLLERAGVLVIPGIGYGEHGEGYIRMSLTVLGDRNGERVAEAVARIRQYVPRD
ncbi:MAG: LL-diaminopimelate aminotransferase [Chloroherpetonaceae bacterium]|nr:LL-diaminopimelate aminotransferase [Chthonomonadaceae bacterium]MDW8207668.1 LL-diaminopimelate aminotransferase [Chloroherpetonaceae bacterium]